jgi:hypothetical protein
MRQAGLESLHCWIFNPREITPRWWQSQDLSTRRVFAREQIYGMDRAALFGRELHGDDSIFKVRELRPAAVRVQRSSLSKSGYEPTVSQPLRDFYSGMPDEHCFSGAWSIAPRPRRNLTIEYRKPTVDYECKALSVACDRS